MAEFDSIRSSTRSDSYVNIDSGLRAHMNKVYGLMAVAMIITGAVAWSIGTSPQLVSALFSNSIISLIVMFAPLGFVFFHRTYLFPSVLIGFDEKSIGVP